MNYQLKELVSIQSGTYAKTIVKGEVSYVQARHFDDTGTQVQKFIPDLRMKDVSNHHLLNSGDILFAAKGTKNFAVTVSEGWGPAIASTSFIVLRKRTDRVLPEYISWFLNQPDPMKLLKSRAKGTAIVSIGKSALEDLEVPVPPVPIQKLVLKISALRKLERSLRHEMESLQEQYLQHLLAQAIQQ